MNDLSKVMRSSVLDASWLPLPCSTGLLPSPRSAQLTGGIGLPIMPSLH